MLDKRSLYRLPWSRHDNPIAWLEITDICDIQCPCCYRQQLTGHKSFEQIKDEILFLKQERNADNISIAGGEPLLHPDLIDIITFIAEQELKPIIITNAVKLTPRFLQELKLAGTSGFTLHIDSRQARPGWEGASEQDLNELRQQYADMIHSEGNMLAFFNSTVFPDTLDDIPAIVRWAHSQVTKVHGLVFITFRYAPENVARTMEIASSEDNVSRLGYVSSDADEIHLTSNDVYTMIRDHEPLYNPSSYLGGSVLHTSIKWLVGTMLGSRYGMYGSLGEKTMELSQTMHHAWHGRYASYFTNTIVGNRAFLAGCWDRSVRAASLNRVKEIIRRPWRIFTRIHMQSIVIVQAPDFLPDGRVDMCGSCPDTTVYNGRLVHSCRLDEYRLFGALLTDVSVPGSDSPSVTPAQTSRNE
jgi:hypothetical protein